MRQLVAFLLAGLVVGCADQNPGPVTDSQMGKQPAPIATAAICRLSPEGGPVLADRGIGGTGAPGAKLLPASAVSQVADRGIGGTGIVGVITGFASVCVNGLEVAYDDTVPVDLDGKATPVSALRAGEVVVIQADGPVAAPHARSMSLRQEVSGRIESVELGSGLLTIAGVPVSVPTGTWGANRFGLGDWVAVSGLPRADGVIMASRLDVAPPGVFRVHGQIAKNGTTASIGRLTLPPPMTAGVQEGQPVIVTGVYADGRKQPSAISSDRLPADPASYFGPSVSHVVMQAFVRVAPGGVWLNGRKIAASPDLRGASGPDGLAVVSLERKPDGSFSATELRATDLRTVGVAPTSGSRGFGLGNTSPSVARHASLTPTRPDAAGAGALTNYQPAAGATSVGTMPTTSPLPASVSPLSSSPSGSTPAGTISSVPASVVVAPTNSPPMMTVPSIVAPPSTSPVPLITPSIVAPPGLATGSPPVATPAPAAGMPPAVVQAPPPVVPPTGMPQIESIYAPLISSNDGPSAIPSVTGGRSGPGVVLASQAVHASTLPGLTSKPTISLVATVGLPNPAARPAVAASSVLSTLRTSPALSALVSGRAGRH